MACGELDAFKSFRWIEADTIQMSLIGIPREISYCDNEPLEQLLLGAQHGVEPIGPLLLWTISRSRGLRDGAPHGRPGAVNP